MRRHVDTTVEEGPGPRVIAKTPLDDPQTASPPTVAVAPRIVRSERGLARGLAKEDRHHYRRRRAAWPFAAVNLPFRLARMASRMLAGNWSTEIQIPGDPKQ